MHQTLIPLDKTHRNSNRQARRQEIQAQWSADERSARAAAGRRRQEQLAQLLFDQAEPEIWAVGAPCDRDLSRLAG